MNINEILSILPHRFPFLLIDKVIKLDPPPSTGNWVGRKIEAIKNVTVNEPFFPGHFPQQPIMPGVLMIEALAQASALLGYRPPTPGAKMDVVFASVDNCRFRRPVLPGDQLRLCSEIVKDRGSIFAFHVEAYVGDEMAAEADIMAKSAFRKE